VVCGVWCVVCGVWCVVCGVWCVVCGVWCVVCVILIRPDVIEFPQKRQMKQQKRPVKETYKTKTHFFVRSK